MNKTISLASSNGVASVASIEEFSPRKIDYKLRARVVEAVTGFLRTRPVYLSVGITCIRDPEILEIAIVDHDGAVLLDSLINPKTPIPYPYDFLELLEISHEDLSNAPTLDDLYPQISSILNRRSLCSYDLQSDINILTRKHPLPTILQLRSAKHTYARYWQSPIKYRIGYRYHRLSVALGLQDIAPPKGNPHRALTVATATRLLMNNIVAGRMI